MLWVAFSFRELKASPRCSHCLLGQTSRYLYQISLCNCKWILINQRAGNSQCGIAMDAFRRFDTIKTRKNSCIPVQITPGNHTYYCRYVPKIWSVYDWHYDDVIMTTIASQITSLTVVYSIVYSDADERKHQSSTSLAFVWGIHRDRWIPRTKGQLRGKCFHLMSSSWTDMFYRPAFEGWQLSNWRTKPVSWRVNTTSRHKQVRFTDVRELNMSYYDNAKWFRKYTEKLEFLRENLMDETDIGWNSL